MTIKELPEKPLTMLKLQYLCFKLGKTSWNELSNVDNLVTMEELIDFYGSKTEFDLDEFNSEYEHTAYSY